MAPKQKTSKAAEFRRDRAVARYLLITRNLVRPRPDLDIANLHDEQSPPFVAQSSADTALSAFAQLGALRLNARRCLISLLDSQNQYILAEATRSISLQSDTRPDSIKDKLWLGSIVIPRDQGVCQTVLSATSADEPAQNRSDPDDLVVITDLRCDPFVSHLPLVQKHEPGRFYAGAPIRSSDGVIIGAYCVFDDQPRQGLDKNLKIFLQDMAVTVMDHLEDCRLRILQGQSSRLLRGLESFVAGLSSTKTSPFGASSHDESSSANATSTSQFKMNHHPYSHTHSEAPQEARGRPTAESHSLKEEFSSTQSREAPEANPPDYYENIFSRAASIIQTASDFDGVAFVSAASATTSTRTTQQKHLATSRSSHDSGSLVTSQKSGVSSSSAEDDSATDGSTEPEKASHLSKTDVEKMQRASQILSIALSSQRGSPGPGMSKNFRLPVRDLKSLLANSPEGDCFILNSAGQLLQSDVSSSGSEAEQKAIAAQVIAAVSDEGEATGARTEPRREKARLRAGMASTLLNACHGARSLIFLPLWDYERHHWSAACICWTTSVTRDLKDDGSLSYLRIFGTSIMHTIYRLRALEADQAKTTFVASISHELRSPLHGILGNVELLHDTIPNRAQMPLIESIAACGRTLLDTVDHVLDFAKINMISKYNIDGSTRKEQRRRDDSQGEQFRNQSAANGYLLRAVDLRHLAEELIDSVLAAQIVDRNLYDMVNVGYTPELSGQGHRRSLPSTGEGHNEAFQRGAVKIIFDVAYSKSWTFRTEPGAWKRILMNLLGNSLKYTNSGFVYISLTTSEDTARPGYYRVDLSVKDSGIGISADYLRNRLYMPFSQEDSFAPGTGLGLSIVRQLVSKMKGTLEVESEQGLGTTVRIGATLPAMEASPESFSFTPVSKETPAVPTKGKRAIILNRETKSPTQNLSGAAKRALLYECDSTAKLLKDWFAMNVEIKSHLDGAFPDVVVCAEPSFIQLETIRKSRPKDVSTLVVFVARDALEAAVLGADARLAPPNRDVRIITQPCGLTKLEKVFTEFYSNPPLSSSAFTATEPKKPLSRLRSNDGNMNDQRIDLAHRFQSRQLQTSQSAIDSPTSNDVAHSAGLSAEQKCLLVDDNPINLRLLAMQMKKRNIRHKEASNGKIAVEMYKEEHGSFDFILMDISMPIMDGMTATREIRQLEKDASMKRTPIVAMTGLASAAAQEEAQNAGMDYFFTKPVQFRRLDEVLQKI